MTDGENLALRMSERWRPPAFTPSTGRLGRLRAAVRRALDLQAESIWRDLRPLLAQATGTVVDVGCGAQPYRGLLPGGVRYIGLDTPSALTDFGYSMPDVLVIEDGRWPVDDGAAETVLATETVEHVFDTAAFLAEASRALAPGGRLVVTVPFAARWHYIPHDYWRFTPASLRRLLEQAGFSAVVVHGRGNELTVACYKVQALLLPLLMRENAFGQTRPRPLGLVAAVPIAVLAAVGRMSLRAAAGDDCLGFTVTAVRER